MTIPRLTSRRTKLERKRGDVIGLIIKGETDAQIARIIGCARPSVKGFKVRHAEEIAAGRAKLQRELTDYAIAHKVNRMAGYDRDYQLLGEVIEARANDKRYDEPGYSTGLMAHSLKSVGSGENSQVVDEYKVDVAVIAERRALAHAAAEETGQLPRPDVHVGDKHTFFIQVNAPHDHGDIPELG